MSALKSFIEGFARENGVDESKVKSFIDNRSECNTLTDVMNLPYELQDHDDWMPEEPIESYIKDWSVQRHEVIKLDRLIESLSDGFSYHMDWIDSGVQDMTKVEIEKLIVGRFPHYAGTMEVDVQELTLEKIEKILAENEENESFEEFKSLLKIKDVIFYIIDSRFGSAVIDW